MDLAVFKESANNIWKDFNLHGYKVFKDILPSFLCYNQDGFDGNLQIGFQFFHSLYPDFILRRNNKSKKSKKKKQRRQTCAVTTKEQQTKQKEIDEYQFDGFDKTTIEKWKQTYHKKVEDYRYYQKERNKSKQKSEKCTDFTSHIQAIKHILFQFQWVTFDLFDDTSTSSDPNSCNQAIIVISNLPPDHKKVESLKAVVSMAEKKNIKLLWWCLNEYEISKHTITKLNNVLSRGEISDNVLTMSQIIYGKYLTTCGETTLNVFNGCTFPRQRLKRILVLWKGGFQVSTQKWDIPPRDTGTVQIVTMSHSDLILPENVDFNPKSVEKETSVSIVITGKIAFEQIP
eukprot:UN32079